MKLSRRLRKALTVTALQMGQNFAQRSNWRSLEHMRSGLLATTKLAFPLRRILQTNMLHAGVYRSGLLDAYFERAVDQLMMLAHIFRAGLPQSGCRERFHFDNSFSILQQAYDRGKGVICIAPHICGYPVYGVVISNRIPCVIYARLNKDPKKMHITEMLGKAADGELVSPPENATKSQRLNVAIDVLRQGRMMFITPDTPRKSYEGVPVTIMGREVYFPTGVFVMSLRTGAAVVPTWWHWQDGAYQVSFTDPFELNRGGKLHQKATAATQQWAAQVDAFLRLHPNMWWNWLDKRWTRILRNGS